MCKKQTSVSHSSTESKVISFDACSRMDGIPYSSKNTHQAVSDHCRKEHVDDQVPRSRACSEIKSTNPNTKSKRHGNREVDELSNVEHVVTSEKPSQFESQLYILEDNEAVIKMINKGRSPTVRHVSRTHGVALDWLFDRINLDPKIQIRYVDTKNQLADMLTQGNLTRDEWNNLLHLFNISHFSFTCCAKNSTLISCTKNDGETDARRERRREDCGKVKACN